MEEDQAVKFIERMFSMRRRTGWPSLRSAGGGKAEQRVFTPPQATSRKVQAWLRHLNARDYDIYLCVNPVRPGSGGREKGDIDEIRRLQLDLTREGATGLGRVLEEVDRGELPRPAHVLRSSKDRYRSCGTRFPGSGRWKGPRR